MACGRLRTPGFSAGHRSSSGSGFEPTDMDRVERLRDGPGYGAVNADYEAGFVLLSPRDVCVARSRACAEGT